MSSIFLILMSLAMLAVLVSLGVGLVGLARGGDFNRRHANRLMRLRVLSQGLALGFFVLALFSAG